MSGTSASTNDPDRIRQLIIARREALANLIAAQPGAWMGIPGWARWFRRGYQLLRRDLGSPAPPRRQ